METLRICVNMYKCGLNSETDLLPGRLVINRGVIGILIAELLGIVRSPAFF